MAICNQILCLFLFLQQKQHKCLLCFSLNCILRDKPYSSKHNLLLITAARLGLHLCCIIMKVWCFLPSQNNKIKGRKKIRFKPQRMCCLRESVCVCVHCLWKWHSSYRQSGLFEQIPVAAYSKGTLSFCSPAIGLTFVLSHSHLFIWRSGNERMVSRSRRIAWRRRRTQTFFLFIYYLSLRPSNENAAVYKPESWKKAATALWTVN